MEREEGFALKVWVTGGAGKGRPEKLEAARGGGEGAGMGSVLRAVEVPTGTIRT